MIRTLKVFMLTSIGLSSGFHAGVGSALPLAPSVYPTVKTAHQAATGIALHQLKSDPEQQYFLYVPPQSGSGRPVFVYRIGATDAARWHSTAARAGR